jgi:hypothetical protein
MPKDLWGNEIIVEPETVKKKKRQVAYNNVRRFKPVSTDITLWFSENKPKTLAECADLKKALRTKSKVGKYVVDVLGPKKGMKTVFVCGPAGEVALKSVAARKLFNRRLAAIEQFMEINLRQSGTETPVFEGSRPILSLD